jgi:hypothetical protein
MNYHMPIALMVHIHQIYMVFVHNNQLENKWNSIKFKYINLISYFDNFLVDLKHFYTMVLFLQDNHLLLYMNYVLDFDYQQKEKHNQLYLEKNKLLEKAKQNSYKIKFTILTISSSITRCTITSIISHW